MQSTASTLMMATLGLIFMVQMSLAVPDKIRQVAVVLPPWQTGGMALAANLNAPIVDLIWRGHVIILDVSRDPMAVTRLKDAGFYLLETNIRSGCTPDKAV